MKQLLRKFKQISILILAIAVTSCEKDEVVLPQVVAGFTYTVNADTGTVTFINTSVNATGHEWDFGDESSSTLINPVKVYPNGTYTVILTAKNVAGAFDIFQDDITILIPEIATLPITFDGANTNYDAVVFGGTSFEVVDNPDLSGSNPSASKVGAVTNIGAVSEGFYFDLGADVDLTTDKSISMNFWADTPVDVLVKLEEGTAGSIEATVSHGGTGWETIISNFTSSDSYSRLTMAVDPALTTAGTFYLDDITQIETPVVCAPETMQSLGGADLNLTFMSDPTTSIIEDGGDFEWIDNPDFNNEVNMSCKVGKITKLGANPWDNNQIDLDAKLDFSVNEGLKIKVWSARENTEVRIKLEEIGNSGNFNEQFLTTSVTSGWEELTFPYTSADSDKFDKIVIFFDLNAENTDTYYFDDLMLYGSSSVACTAETTESMSAADLNMTFLTDPSADFIADGASISRISNPDVENEVNSSCQIAQVVKSGDFPYDNIQYDLDAKFDFTANEGLKIKVWSARANTEVRIKLEEIGNSGNFNEQFLTTSVTSAWEELTFPYSASDSDKFNKIVIFFDLDANNTDTYYFDDLMLYGSDPGGGTGDNLLTNGDFENGTEAWSGNALNVLTEGGNSFNFANVATAGDAFNVNLSQVVEIIEGKTYKITFDASSDRSRTMLAGIGLNEDPWTDNTQSVNLTTATQPFTLELTATGFGGANSRVIFDMGAEVGVVVIDNVTLVCLDCDSGGGPGPGDNLAINGDFETGDDTGWLLFPNGGTSALDNTINNGGSWSGKLATGGPSNPAFKQERIGAGTVVAGDVVQVKFDHIGAVAGEGGVFNVLLFGEGAGGSVPFTHIFNPAPSLAASWTTFTGTFTIPGGTDVSEGISFLIETVCGGATGCDVSANIDNVSVTLNP